MKHLLLNCDQVFDVLTRGPFPTGAADDDGVEHHLRACHDCRQLAEALRPAVALLHEAVVGEEALRLPAYQGSLPALAAQPVRLAARAKAVARAADRWGHSLDVLRLIASAVLVATISLLVFSATMTSRNNPPVQSPAAGLAMLAANTASRAGVPDELGLIRLASLRLPAACLPAGHRELLAQDPAELVARLASSQTDALRCCTECHRAGLASAAKLPVAAIAKESCQACHRG